MSTITIDERSALVPVDTAYSEFRGLLAAARRHRRSQAALGRVHRNGADLQLRRRGVTQIVLAGIGLGAERAGDGHPG